MVGVVEVTTGKTGVVEFNAVMVGVSLAATGNDVWVIGLGRNMDSSGGLKVYLILVITLSSRHDSLL